MLGKLLKYEWKASGRLLLLIYAALVAIALAGGISLRFGTYDHNRDLLVLILALIYMLLVFVMVVVTMVMIVTRFYKNLFSQEGYLMHTLPVPAWQLVASKAIVGILWVAIGCAVVLVSFGAAFAGAGVLKEAWAAFDLLDMERILAENGVMILLMLAAVFVQILRIILQAYVSMTIGCAANKHKILYSVLIFVGIVIVLNVVTAVVWLTGFTPFDTAFPVLFADYAGIVAQIIFEGILIVLFFVLTNIFITKRLNLE